MKGSELEFDWDEVNVGHVARHSVLPEEAEQVVLNDPLDLGMEMIKGEERFLNLGANRPRPCSSCGDYVAQTPHTYRNGVRANPAARSVLLPGTREAIMTNRKPPSFDTEADEAEWWAKNQELIAEGFEEAKTANKLGRGTVARVARERSSTGASPTITIRLAEDDLARARTFAAEKGLRYQTYLKMLLHEALNSEERRAGRR